MTAPRCGLSPLAKLCSAAPESTSSSPRPAQRLGWAERNGRLWPRQALSCSQGHEWALGSLANLLGKTPIWLQLPTTQDGGDPRREMFHPEHKLLGRLLGGGGYGTGQSHWPLAQAQQVSFPWSLVGHTASPPQGTPCSCLLSCEPWGGLVPSTPALPHVLRGVWGFR